MLGIPSTEDIEGFDRIAEENLDADEVVFYIPWQHNYMASKGASHTNVRYDLVENAYLDVG